MGRPGVLLDRDGTIIVDSGYVGSVDRVTFIAGAIEAVGALNAAGMPVAVVTNQAGVARGHYTPGRRASGARPHRREAGGRGGARRPVAVLPLPPGRGQWMRSRGSARTGSRRREWPWLRRRPWTWTSALRGWWVTPPRMSAWPAPSVRDPCSSARRRATRRSSPCRTSSAAVERILRAEERQVGTEPARRLPGEPIPRCPVRDSRRLRQGLRSRARQGPRDGRPGPGREGGGHAQRGLRPRRGGLRLRQRRVGVHRQPPPVRPQQGSPQRHGAADQGA